MISATFSTFRKFIGLLQSVLIPANGRVLQILSPPHNLSVSLSVILRLPNVFGDLIQSAVIRVRKIPIPDKKRMPPLQLSTLSIVSVLGLTSSHRLRLQPVTRVSNLPCLSEAAHSRPLLRRGNTNKCMDLLFVSKLI
jgi:hypothetical protein